jgi:Arc/MetJ family transcription regulator
LNFKGTAIAIEGIKKLAKEKKIEIVRLSSTPQKNDLSCQYYNMTKKVYLEASMRTTLAVREELIEEVKALSGVKTKKAAVEKALEEFIRRRKAKKLLDYEGKIELSYTLSGLIERRKKDVPHR